MGPGERANLFVGGTALAARLVVIMPGAAGTAFPGIKFFDAMSSGAKGDYIRAKKLLRDAHANIGILKAALGCAEDDRVPDLSPHKPSPIPVRWRCGTS